MTECIAMAVGFMMGAGCVLGALVVCRPRNTGESETEGRRAEGGTPYNEREKIMMQWENFLNYDGSGKGQVSIEDGEE